MDAKQKEWDEDCDSEKTRISYSITSVYMIFSVDNSALKLRLS